MDSGIVLATPKILAAEGVNIILNDKTHTELEKAAKEVRFHAKSTNHIVAVSADLTKDEEIQMLVREAKKKFDGTDIVVNYAGIRGAVGDFLTLSDEDCYSTIDIDLMGAVRVCRAPDVGKRMGPHCAHSL